MNTQTKLEGTVYSYNGRHWVKEDKVTMPVEDAVSYLFFKYGCKGNVTSKLLAKLAFEWASANREMDELIRKKKEGKV